MRAHIAAVLFTVAVGGGCYATTGVGYSGGAYVAPAPVYTQTTATVTVDGGYEPDLVDAGGGVQVIADYDQPVFYTDNYYWRYDNNIWYRSNVYNGGWTVYNDVPYSVRRIERPHAYVRYRPSGYVPRAQRNRDYNRGPAVRDHRDNRDYNRGPAVRDHRDNRDNRGPAVRDHREPYRPAPQPAVRDHRAPAPAPVVRDHRAPAPAPVVRDHRDNRAPAPAPAARDHRRNDDDDKKRPRRR